MDNEHGTAHSARDSIAEHPTLSVDTINTLLHCLENSQALTNYVGRTAQLLEALKRDDLVQWVNITLKIGTQKMLDLARDLELSAVDSREVDISQSDGIHTHDSTAPDVLALPINTFLRAPLQHSPSARHSSAPGQSVTPVRVHCPQPDCSRTYMPSRLERFLGQHLILVHGFAREKAIAEVSALTTASGVGYHQPSTPEFSMGRVQYDRGDSQMPVQSHSAAMAGVGQQFGTNESMLCDPPFIDGRRSRFTTTGCAGISADDLARYSTQPSPASGQCFGQQLGGSIIHTSTTDPFNARFGSPFAPRSTQQSPWKDAYDIASMEADYPPYFRHDYGTAVSGGSGIPDSSADAVCRHTYGQGASCG